METKANYLLIGAFSLAGFLGILGFVIWFANLELNRQFAYYDVYFPDVSGVSISSDVRFAGLSVGTVVDMQLAQDSEGAVRVRLEMVEGTPVRTDSVAGLAVQGVTGTFAVSITSGSPEAPLLRATADAAVPVIPSSRSIFQTLSDEGPEMIRRLGEIAEDLAILLGDENQMRVANILGNIERSTGNLDQAISDVSTATGSIASAAEDIAGFGTQLGEIGAAATGTLANVDTALATLGESAARADLMMEAGRGALDEVQSFVATDLRRLTDRMGTTAAALEGTLVSLDPAIGAAGRAFDSADRVLGTDIAPVTEDLRITLGNLNTAILGVTDDLPAITGEIRGAAQSASSAFASLNAMADGLSAPVQAFARGGVPQLTRAAAELRGVIANIDQFVTSLRRDPSQFLSRPTAPEFRR